MSDLLIAEPYQLSPTRYGTMLVNRNDVYMGQSYLHYGECSEHEIRVLFHLLQLPGLVIDAGANMGVHTIPLAKKLAEQGRTMLAFEPQPVIFQQLCANLAINGLMNVVALPYACGSEKGVVSFAAPDYRHRGNFGGISMSNRTAISAVTTAPCYPLDELVGETQVAVIKIDVEGFELEVLKGARGILAYSSPALYVENDRVEKSEALIRWLMDRGYRMWWHNTPIYNPNNFFGNKENLYGFTSCFNMLCLHQHHNITVEGLEPVTDPAHHPLNALAAV